MGKTRKGSYVVGDVVRFRGRPDMVRDRIVETARSDTVRIKISMPKEPTGLPISRSSKPLRAAGVKSVGGEGRLRSPKT